MLCDPMNPMFLRVSFLVGDMFCETPPCRPVESNPDNRTRQVLRRRIWTDDAAKLLQHQSVP